MVCDGVGARSMNAQRAAVLASVGAVDPYVYVVPSPRVTSRLAGRTAMSFTSMKGVPGGYQHLGFLQQGPQT